MSEWVLSFCIPTYSRSTKVVGLVESILAADVEGVEVVVSDNASGDDTVARLRRIDNPNLSLFTSEVNRGSLNNGLNALSQARGRYAVILLDKDSVDPRGIRAFRDFLAEQEGLACGYCAYESASPDRFVRWSRGRVALDQMGYRGSHPTGIFLELAMLRSIDFTRRFSDFDFVGHFPFDYILAEMALLGDAVVYLPPLFAPEPTGAAAATKSFGTNASLEDAFFSPRGRLKTAVTSMRHIRTLPISEAQKSALIVERFIGGVRSATVGYRSIMSDPAICGHYHVAPRNVGVFEMLSTAVSFYRSFSRETRASDGASAARTSVAFNVELSLSLWRRVSRKLLARAA